MGCLLLTLELRAELTGLLIVNHQTDYYHNHQV